MHVRHDVLAIVLIQTAVYHVLFEPFAQGFVFPPMPFRNQYTTATTATERARYPAAATVGRRSVQHHQIEHHNICTSGSATSGIARRPIRGSICMKPARRNTVSWRHRRGAEPAAGSGFAPLGLNPAGTSTAESSVTPSPTDASASFHESDVAASTSTRETAAEELQKKRSKGMTKEKRSDRKGLFLLATVPLVWGTYAPSVKYMYEMSDGAASPPGLLFNFSSYVVALVTLAGAAWVNKMRGRSAGEREGELPYCLFQRACMDWG